MSIIARNATLSRAVRPVGRPRGSFSPELPAERIEGHAMGVVSETTFGARDLSEAVALERMEGGMVKQIRLQVEQSLGYLAEGRVGKAMGILRACLVGLDQIEMLDQAEAELLTEDTSAHLRGARDEGREIISLTQPMHVVA